MHMRMFVRCECVLSTKNNGSKSVSFPFCCCSNIWISIKMYVLINIYKQPVRHRWSGRKRRREGSEHSECCTAYILSVDELVQFRVWDWLAKSNKIADDFPYGIRIHTLINSIENVVVAIIKPGEWLKRRKKCTHVQQHTTTRAVLISKKNSIHHGSPDFFSFWYKTMINHSFSPIG